jgi:hypothetical protein
MAKRIAIIGARPGGLAQLRAFEALRRAITGLQTEVGVDNHILSPEPQPPNILPPASAGSFNHLESS